MDTLNKIYLLLRSTRMKTVYWNAFFIVIAEMVNMFAENISSFSLPDWAMVFCGLILAAISKGIKNKMDNKLSGWSIIKHNK